MIIPESSRYFKNILEIIFKKKQNIGMILFPLGSMPILDFTIKTEVGHSSWYVCTMKCLRFRNNRENKNSFVPGYIEIH